MYIIINTSFQDIDPICFESSDKFSKEEFIKYETTIKYWIKSYCPSKSPVNPHLLCVDNQVGIV